MVSTGAAPAPDYVEPIYGWRVWDVIELDRALRLCSLAFWTVWLPRREAVALCRRSLVNLAWAGLPSHTAPQARCSCGIYATQTATQATAYLSRQFRRRADTLHRVVGIVALWGTVVESERGWRGSHSYPAILYVPTARPRLRSPLANLPRPRLPAEEIARGLADYGVPVELVDCATAAELAEAIELRGTPPW